MAWFTGTSTGNKYTVGQQYVSAGQTYVANANGSFTNVNSGKTNPGSSQSDSVQFGGSASRVTASALPALWSSDPQWRGTGGSGSSGATSGTGPMTRGPGANGAISGTKQQLNASVQAGYGVGVNGGGGVVMTTRKGATLKPIGGAKGGIGVVGSGVSQTKFGQVKDMPMERVGNGGWSDPGTISDIGWMKTRTGWAVTYSQDAKDRTEDDLYEQTSWAVRNRLIPLITRDPPFPDFIGDRKDFEFNELGQEWVPYKAPPIHWQDPVKLYRQLGQYP